MTDRGALYLVDPSTLELVLSDGTLSADHPGRAEVYSLFPDDDGEVWVYGVAGLWRFRPSTREWTLRRPRREDEDFVRAIARDSSGALWFGTDHSGIAILPAGNKLIRLARDPSDDRSLGDNTVTALRSDSAGSVWAGTLKGGISLYNPAAIKFDVDPVGDVNCIAEAADGGVFLGTNGLGLLLTDRSGAVVRSFTHNPSDPASISGDVVVCMHRDRAGRLWTGTFWGGLDCLSGGRFTRYDTVRGGAPARANVWTLAEDGLGNIWAGTLGGGLLCLDPKTGSLTVYDTSNSDIVSDYVISVCTDRAGRLVIGTTAGVSVMDLSTRKISRNLTDTALRPVLDGSNIIQVFTDSRGMLWIATQSGLYVYDPAVGGVFDVPLGPVPPGSFILGLAEDTNLNIWVSVGEKLVNILPIKDVRDSRPFFGCYGYSESDGLYPCNFNQRSLACLSSGEILGGSLYGLTRFHPDRFTYNRTGPRVMFTGLSLFDEEVEVGAVHNGNVILPRDLNEPDCTVRLRYRENAFTVRFASDNYILPGKTLYSYCLDGFSDEWLTADPGAPQATYTNLSPGNYTLRVKAVNGDGYAGAGEAALRITVRPPFWMTPWAYALYALLVAGVIFLIFLVVRLAERRRYRKLLEPEPEEIEITSLDEKLVGNATRKVEEHISDPGFTVEALSGELGMSRVQLYKKLVRITGKSPVEFIRTVRLKRAAQYLRESQLNVSEVAYRVGFNNPRYFAQYFREEYGVLPSEYRSKDGKKGVPHDAGGGCNILILNELIPFLARARGFVGLCVSCERCVVAGAV